jgi:hypothetical protein
VLKRNKYITYVAADMLARTRFEVTTRFFEVYLFSYDEKNKWYADMFVRKEWHFVHVMSIMDTLPPFKERVAKLRGLIKHFYGEEDKYLRNEILKMYLCAVELRLHELREKMINENPGLLLWEH